MIGRLLAAGVVVVAGGTGGAVVGMQQAAASPRTIVITIHHSRFRPEQVVVPRGRPVRFVVHNTDPIDHELIVGDAAVQLAHEHGRETEHRAPGAVSVPAETTRSTTVTFDRSGFSQFACHVPGHWAYGMQGIVVVS